MIVLISLSSFITFVFVKKDGLYISSGLRFWCKLLFLVDVFNKKQRWRILFLKSDQLEKKKKQQKKKKPEIFTISKEKKKTIDFFF